MNLIIQFGCAELPQTLFKTFNWASLRVFPHCCWDKCNSRAIPHIFPHRWFSAAMAKKQANQTSFHSLDMAITIVHVLCDVKNQEAYPLNWVSMLLGSQNYHRSTTETVSTNIMKNFYQTFMTHNNYNCSKNTYSAWHLRPISNDRLMYIIKILIKGNSDLICFLSSF